MRADNGDCTNCGDCVVCGQSNRDDREELGALRKRLAELEALNEAAARAVDALEGMQIGVKGAPGYKAGRHIVAIEGHDLLDEPWEEESRRCCRRRGRHSPTSSVTNWRRRAAAGAGRSTPAAGAGTTSEPAIRPSGRGLRLRSPPERSRLVGRRVLPGVRRGRLRNLSPCSGSAADHASRSILIPPVITGANGGTRTPTVLPTGT